METFHLRVFQLQVLHQCQFLLFAAADVNQGLKAQSVHRVMYALQNMLNAGANISKMLWGQRGRCAEQRKPLRESIGISDSSPLRDVNMRNHFEHMDERIDRWWAESKRHNYSDMTMGNRATIVGLDPTDMFRWFDPATTDIIFWGEEFRLQPLVDEVQRLLPKLQEEASKPHLGRHSRDN